MPLSGTAEETVEQVAGTQAGKDGVLLALRTGQDAQDGRLEIVVHTLDRHAP